MALFCPGSSSAGKSGKVGKRNAKNKSSKTGPFPLDGISPGGSEKFPLRIHTEPHPRMLVIQDFVPYNHRELRAVRGAVVELLGGEKDWVYARTESGEKGFIPRSHCVALPLEEPVPASRSEFDFGLAAPAVNGRSHSTPVAPYGDTPPLYSPGVGLAERLKSSQNSPLPHLALFRNSSNGSVEDGLVRKDRSSRSGGSWNSSDVFSTDSRGRERQPDEPLLHLNGRTSSTSTAQDMEALLYRTRPLPSLPRDSPRLSEGDSLYHTIMRDSSMSPEPEAVPRPSASDPLQHPLRGASPLGAFVLNSVARRRHGSMNENRVRKVAVATATLEGSTPALLMHRTSSDGSKAFSHVSDGRSSNPNAASSLLLLPAAAEAKSLSPDGNHPDCTKFRKVVWGVYEVASGFAGLDENEISIRSGERVSLLNQDDPHWFWVVHMDTAEEGFVPKACLREHLPQHSEAEYDVVLPRTTSSPVPPQRALNHNSRSKSLPRNAGLKCNSSSALDDKKKMASFVRSGKASRNSSPAVPSFDWSRGHHVTSETTPYNGDLMCPTYPATMVTEHPLHHAARGKSLEKYKRHSTDDNLLNKISSLGLGNKSEDSGIIMIDYDDTGTLV